MNIFGEENENYLEVLEELRETRNTLQKVNDIVLRTVTSGEAEHRDYETSFDEILHILLSDAESRRSGRSD